MNHRYSRLAQQMRQAVDKSQQHLDEAKAKYATATRDGFEVPLIGIPKTAEPSKGDFREDSQPLADPADGRNSLPPSDRE